MCWQGEIFDTWFHLPKHLLSSPSPALSYFGGTHRKKVVVVEVFICAKELCLRDVPSISMGRNSNCPNNVMWCKGCAKVREAQQISVPSFEFTFNQCVNFGRPRRLGSVTLGHSAVPSQSVIDASTNYSLRKNPYHKSRKDCRNE